MEPDIVFYIVAALAVFVAGISKGGFGGALGMVSTPAIAMLVHPLTAAAIMLPCLIAMDVLGLYRFRAHWQIRHLWPVFPGAIIGVTLGGLLVNVFSQQQWLLITGLTILVLVVLARLQPHPIAPQWLRGLGWGGVSGLTSFIVHAGAPPLHQFLLRENLVGRAFVATSFIFFFTVNSMKLVPYISTGMLTAETAQVSLYLIPAGLLGVLVGEHILSRFSAAQFRLWIQGLIILAGLTLTIKGLLHS